MPPSSLHIRPLADLPSALPLLERWFVAEWYGYYGPDGPADARRDLTDCARAQGLPYAVVAVDEENRVLGTAALRTDSLGAELGIGPWLAALLVGPRHRRRGIGSALVAAIEGRARLLGCPALYTATDGAKHLIEKRGWTPIAATQGDRGPLTVYRLPL